MVGQGPASAGGTRFDAFKLAAEGESLSGELDARSLGRVADRLAPGKLPAPVHWQIEGKHDALRRPILAVAVEAMLPMICQRCLQAFELSIAQQTRLLLAHDDAELKLLDAEEPEVLLAAAQLDARTLVEDELLLSLPFAPHHPEGLCEQGKGWGAAAPEGQGKSAQSPFAALAELRHRR